MEDEEWVCGACRQEKEGDSAVVGKEDAVESEGDLARGTNGWVKRHCLPCQLCQGQ